MIINTPVPEEFIERMRTQLGDDAEDFIQSLSTPPAVGVRLNIRKRASMPEWFQNATSVAWCSSGYRLPTRPIFTQNPQLHQGVFYVQEPASMVYESIVRAIAGDKPVRFADFCAAPGGKTTAAINGLADGSLVVANEYTASRVGILKENLMKWGYPDIVITSSNTTKFRNLPGFFDIIAVDAPCSGEGMMRKEDVARTQWSASLNMSCAALQRDILDSAWEALSPGGYLIYSTCTFSPLENQEQIERLLDEKGAVSALPCIDGVTPISAGSYEYLAFMPHTTLSEGLFLAVVRKPDDEYRITHRKIKNNRSKHSKRTERSVLPPKDFQLIAGGTHYFACRKSLIEDIRMVEQTVHTISAGVYFGVIKGRDFIPSHHALLCGMFDGCYPTEEVDTVTAQAYLRRETIALRSNVDKGFVMLQYGGFPLGFVKNLGNRCNNLYPKELRVLNKWD